MRLILIAAGALVPGLASAEGLLGTPRSSNLEIRYAPYRPEIDSQFSAPPECTADLPYTRFFGSGSDSLLQLGYERHILQKYGTLSAGGTLGYFNVTGKAQAGGKCSFSASGELVETTASERQSSDEAESSLMIVPVQAQATYRLTIWEDLVPLVPVLRAGLDYYMWRIEDTDGNTASFEPGQEASGGQWGWHFAVGVHLLLDFFSQGMAADFDRDAGVNSTYLTVEYLHAQVDDFGSSDALRLGDKTVVFGLSFDM